MADDLKLRHYPRPIELGRGRSLATIVASMSEVAEGVRTAGAAVELARRHGVEMPIAEAVHAVLEGKLAPSEVADRLMQRQLRPEYE